MLGEIICYNEDPNCIDEIYSVSKKFNEELYRYDFVEPCYRTFIIASRRPVEEPPTKLFPPHEIKDANQRFKDIKEEFLNNVRFQTLKSTVLLEEKNQQLKAKISLLKSDVKQLQAIETNRYTTRGLIKTFIGVLAKTSMGKLSKKIIFSGLSLVEEHRIKSIKYALKNRGGRLVITLPIIDWDFRTQRPQHLNAQIATFNNVVIYVKTGLKPSMPVSKTKQKNWPNDSKQHDLKIYEIQLPCKNHHNIYRQVLDEDNLGTVMAHLEGIIEKIKPSSFNILVQFPSWWPLASSLRQKFNGKIIFDCMDDIAGFTNISAEVIDVEKQAIIESDLVLASSKNLFEKCKTLNSNTALVRNAAEFHHFNTATRNGELNHLLGKPIIGYYGAIAEWFDLEIIEYCAKNCRNWNFVLIGSSSNIDTSQIEELSNIHLLGEIPYDRLPGYIAYFDVATIPFKINNLTEATNPVKFYEYLSAGLPVVSTPLPELEEYKDQCWLASDEKDFLEKLRAALQDKNNTNKLNTYYLLGKRNSWEERARTIIQHAPYLG